jgi:hypothetical protein
MAERAVTEVVRQSHRFREILVEPQDPRGGARDLGYLERVGEPGAKVVAFVIDEHLGLVLEPAKGGAVDDPVAVALERAAQATGRLRMAPATTVVRIARIAGNKTHANAFRPTGAPRRTKAIV